MKRTDEGHFARLDELCIDRSVIDELGAWAHARGLALQDAIQLAVIYHLEHQRVVARVEGLRTRSRCSRCGRFCAVVDREEGEADIIACTVCDYSEAGS